MVATCSWDVCLSVFSSLSPATMQQWTMHFISWTQKGEQYFQKENLIVNHDLFTDVRFQSNMLGKGLCNGAGHDGTTVNPSVLWTPHIRGTRCSTWGRARSALFKTISKKGCAHWATSLRLILLPFNVFLLLHFNSMYYLVLMCCTLASHCVYCVFFWPHILLSCVLSWTVCYCFMFFMVCQGTTDAKKKPSGKHKEPGIQFHLASPIGSLLSAGQVESARESWL